MAHGPSEALGREPGPIKPGFVPPVSSPSSRSSDRLARVLSSLPHHSPTQPPPNPRGDLICGGSQLRPIHRSSGLVHRIPLLDSSDVSICSWGLRWCHGSCVPSVRADLVWDGGTERGGDRIRRGAAGALTGVRSVHRLWIWKGFVGSATASCPSRKSR